MLSCRNAKGNKDMHDIKSLINLLHLTTEKEVRCITYKYYHAGMFPRILTDILEDIFNAK